MTTTFFTVRQAAERAGVSRQTMFRYIKEGKISATLSRSGEKQIQASELIRVFGELQPETVSSRSNKDRSGLSISDRETVQTVTHQLELERLRSQLELKVAELELAKERINELKARENLQSEEKNKLLSIIERQSLLITHTPASPVRKTGQPARSTTSSSKEKTVPKEKETAKQAVSQIKKQPAKKVEQKKLSKKR